MSEFQINNDIWDIPDRVHEHIKQQAEEIKRLESLELEIPILKSSSVLKIFLFVLKRQKSGMEK